MTKYRCVAVILSAFLSFLGYSVAAPVSQAIEDTSNLFLSTPGYAFFLISATAILLLSFVVIGCVCCPNKNIKALTCQNGFPINHLNENGTLQYENASEFAIFPPTTVINLQPVGLSYPGCEDKVTFEPLPDILPRKLSGQSAACSSRPAHFKALLKSKISLHDWFDDPNSNFPRDQLQYYQELGSGWFGRVVEGEAANIVNQNNITAVVVKILREEASPSEHLHFLHEVRPYRDLKHPNIIKLFGRCLESDPFLLIMEHSICDLKSYLILQENKDSLLINGTLLQMMCNIAAGLNYMHENGFAHVDFAAHNCFVSKDSTVKIGDYGISFDKFKDDYYCLGDIALPVRWCSPEILQCTETTIETKEISKEANVWAFGIVLWEVLEFGKLPYDWLTNEEVIQKVLLERSVQLPLPSKEFPVKKELASTMKECWKPVALRPNMNKLETFLIQLHNDWNSLRTQEISFEEQWNSIQPKIIELRTFTSESVTLKFENDFSEKSDSHNYSSDGDRYSSFDSSFDMLSKNISSQLSPSLRVLNGSIDELTENDCFSSMSLGGERSATDVASVLSDREFSQLDEEDQYSSDVHEVMPSSRIEIDTGQHCDVLTEITRPQLHEYIRNSFQQLSQPIGNSNVLIPENQASELTNRIDSNFNQIPLEDYQNSSEHHGSLLGNQKNCSIFVPNIIVYESPSVHSNSPDENENVLEIEEETYIILPDPPKQFRFILKDETSDTIGNISEPECFSTTNTDNSDWDESFKFSEKKIRSERLTSTPMKDNSGIDLSFNKSDSNIINDSNYCDDAFYENSCSHDVDEINIQEKVDKSNRENEQDVDVCNSISTCYYEAASHKSDSYQITNENVSVKTESGEQESFLSAQVTLNNSNDISEPSLLPNGFHDFNENSSMLQDGIRNKNALSSVSNSDMTYACAFSIVETKNFNDNFKCPSGEDVNSEEVDALSGNINGHKSKTLHEDTLSLEFGEPLTPEISINVSSCSYGTDCKSFSTDSPCISSENIRTSGRGTESSLNNCYSNEYTNPCNGMEPSPSKYLRHCRIQTNYPNIDSEASSSEILDSFSPEGTPDPFIGFENRNRMESSGNLRGKKFDLEDNCDHMRYRSKVNAYYDEEDIEIDSEGEGNAHKSNGVLRLHPYNEVIVEDLATGEQTIISESYSACEEYENSAESDEILRINTETDEAILIDSSEALIGFVPSRSIEMLQDIENMPTLENNIKSVDEKESSDSNYLEVPNSESPSPALNTSPCQSPDLGYPFHQPYRNFSLQNEVIEEEITEEIGSPSSIHSTVSFSSNEIFLEEEKMSQSSESYQMQDAPENSSLPYVTTGYDGESEENSKSDDFSSSCSPTHINGEDDQDSDVLVIKDVQNNLILNDQGQDVMNSWQPTQSVLWHLNDTLDIDKDNPIILESQEFMAGEVLETRGMSVKDITRTLNELDAKMHSNRQSRDHLSVSQTPSPYSSVESSPCRDAYTPDFESDSEEESVSGTSCSSTSGSFECIHNKFKDTVDISKILDSDVASEIGGDCNEHSLEHSPLKIFSKTWNCHATPTKGLLVTPEKKFNSMRKSVSFHEEDPQVVFEYPPASDSSEDGGLNDEPDRRVLDYEKIADWEVHANENDEIEEIFEIEELESEPYVRRPVYGVGSTSLLNRPTHYTFTTGFSDDDMDFLENVSHPAESIVPSNSPEEGKGKPVSGDQISELIKSQLNNLALEESRLKWVQDVLNDQAAEFTDKLQPSSVAEQISVQAEAIASNVATEKDDVEEDKQDPIVETKDVEIEETENKLNGLSLESFLQQMNNFENIVIMHEDNLSISDNHEVKICSDDFKYNNSQNDNVSEKINTFTHVEEDCNHPSLPLNIEKDLNIDYQNGNFSDEAFRADEECGIMDKTHLSCLKETHEHQNTSSSSSCESNLKSPLISFDEVNETLNWVVESECQDRQNVIYTPICLTSDKEYEQSLEEMFNSELYTDFNEGPNIKTQSKNSPSELGTEAIDLFLKNNGNMIATNNECTNTPNIEIVNFSYYLSCEILGSVSESEEIKKPLSNELENRIANSVEIPNTSEYHLSGISFQNKKWHPQIDELGNLVSHSDSFSMNECKSKLITNNSNTNYTDNETSSETNILEKTINLNETLSTSELFSETILQNQCHPQINTPENLMIHSDSLSSDKCEAKLITDTTDANYIKSKMSFEANLRIEVETKTKDIKSSSSSQSPSEMPSIQNQWHSEIDELEHTDFSSSENCNFKEYSSDKTSNNGVEPSSEILCRPENSGVEIKVKSCLDNTKNIVNIEDSSKFMEKQIDYSDEITELFLSKSAADNALDIKSVAHEEDNAGNCTSEETSSACLSAEKSKVEAPIITFTLEPKPISQDSKSIPKIVITPAVEHKVEDELEEYLQNQLKYCFDPSEDFSVTSLYSGQPFEDVFGSYDGAAASSSEYAEAFNFEMEHGDFFDEFLEDYRKVAGPDEDDNLVLWNSQNERVITEKSAVDEDSADSSRVYNTSNDTTHF